MRKFAQPAPWKLHKKMALVAWQLAIPTTGCAVDYMVGRLQKRDLYLLVGPTPKKTCPPGELKTGIWEIIRLFLQCLLEMKPLFWICLLYTSDAADDLLCVDLGGRRIIK